MCPHVHPHLQICAVCGDKGDSVHKQASEFGLDQTHGAPRQRGDVFVCVRQREEVIDACLFFRTRQIVGPEAEQEVM